MNERIKELIFEAVSFRLDPDSNAYEAQVCPEELEYLAELIVRECAKVISDGRFSNTECEGNSHRVSYNNGRYGASSDIKKHFGVEE